MSHWRHVVPALALLGALVTSACDDGLPEGRSTGSIDAPATASTFEPVETTPATSAVEDGFRRSVETVCAEVTEALIERAPRDGASPEGAAEALTSMVEANRDGVDRMRELDVPPELQDEFSAWLDLVDETAKHLEVASLALRGGDEPTFAAALADAEDTGAQASAAATELGLPDCAFTG